MADSDDARLSDEATGLPPLEDLDGESTMLVMAWNASEGIAMSPLSHATEPVRFLHLRGLSLAPEDGKPEWVQVHIAVPVEVCLDVAAALAKGTTTELGEETQ